MSTSHEMSIPKPIVISIEGSIGGGKTTLLEQLRQEHPDWHFIDEPLDTWTSLKNEGGENLLQVFYKDIRRWSYTFQNCAILSRAQNIKRAVEDWRAECEVNPDARRHNIFITERCLDTDFNVFAQMLRDDGMLDGIEWDLYKKWYRMLENWVTISGLVYVDTPPEVCSQRIKYRNREGEETISDDYLKRLDVYQRRWIDHTSLQVLRYNNSDNTMTMNTPADVERFVRKL
jgi:deoxyadenosine/deoxycytidine kinase